MEKKLIGNEGDFFFLLSEKCCKCIMHVMCNSSSIGPTVENWCASHPSGQSLEGRGLCLKMIPPTEDMASRRDHTRGCMALG